MIIGVPKEIKTREYRVGMTPAGVRSLTSRGHKVVVEKGAGARGRNLVGVRELDGPDARAAELARMMSGTVTEKALARAHELLEEGQG